MLLIGGLLLFRARLGRAVDKESVIINLNQFDRRNLSRRSGRALVTVGSMAAGVFLVVSTGAFRKSPEESPENYKSGTGGFSYWGESASPIYDDLNGNEAMELFDLNRSLLVGAKVVPLRIREGDDASCLNLNKALRPKIYGVKPADFSGRFEFSEGNWTSLNKVLSGNVVPALVDQNTMMWALKMGLGDRIQFTDGEGKPFDIELVGAFKGSMLQGALSLMKRIFWINLANREGIVALCFRAKRTKQSIWPNIWKIDYFSMASTFVSQRRSWLNFKKWKILIYQFFRDWADWVC